MTAEQLRRCISAWTVSRQDPLRPLFCQIVGYRRFIKFVPRHAVQLDHLSGVLGLVTVNLVWLNLLHSSFSVTGSWWTVRGVNSNVDDMTSSARKWVQYKYVTHMFEIIDGIDDHLLCFYWNQADWSIPRKAFESPCGPELLCKGANGLRELALVFLPRCSNLHWSLLSVRCRCLIVIESYTYLRSYNTLAGKICTPPYSRRQYSQVRWSCIIYEAAKILEISYRSRMSLTLECVKTRWSTSLWGLWRTAWLHSTNRSISKAV